MKSILKQMFAASASIALLASCSKDTIVVDPDPNPDPDPTPIRVELNIKAETYAAVRSLDENSISDVNIYFFNKGNGDDYHFFYSDYAPAFVFEILPGNYTLHVVTNVNRDLGDLTSEALSQYEYSIDNMVGNIPMTASTEISVFGDVTLPALQVKRVAARISYSVMVDAAVAPDIKLRSVQFMNVPKSTVLFGTSSTSTDQNKFFDDEVVETKNEKSYSDTYYLFENCQGDVSGITDQKDKSPEKAPACATYMRILANHVDGGSGKMLEYIVYLGENTTSNFDVRRNTKHTMNLVIRGENEIDNRVTVYDGLYYGKANCYICQGNQVTFDVTAYRTSKAINYAYTGIKAGEDYNPVSARILYSTVSWDKISLSLENNQLTVTVDWPEITPSKGGNSAVIAIVDGNDEILWSFHIWHPRDTITDEEYTNAAGEKFLMMDRNLGELEKYNREGSVSDDKYHCIYEWGRKDPFWHQRYFFYFDNSASRQFFYVVNEPDKNTIVSIEDLHKNPMTFYGDGYTPDDNLWGDPNNTMETYGWTSAKSVYDPCPEGYRVPNAKTWTGFDKKVVGNFLYGWNFKRNSDDKVGTYYSRGCAAMWTANNFGTAVTNTGEYWASSPQYMWFNNNTNSIHYKSYEDDVASSARFGKNRGLQVRCARSM